MINDAKQTLTAIDKVIGGLNNVREYKFRGKRIDNGEQLKRTIDDDYTYGPIWDGGENHEK